MKAWAGFGVPLLILFAAACGTETLEESVPEADVATVARQVQGQAETVGRFVGAAPERQSLRARECAGQGGEQSDRVFGVRGGFHFFLDNPEFTAITAVVRSEWQAAGWAISDDRELPNGDTQLVGKDPATGVELWFVGHQKDKAVSLSVYSACFLSPEPVEFGDVDLPEPSPSPSAS